MNPRDDYPPTQRNLVYAEHPGRQLLLDFYRPDTSLRVPAVIYFHSGGWRSGSKDSCKLQWLTAWGFAVVSVNYRLLPRFKFPTPLLDAKAAVRFVRGRADELGLEPEQIAAAGVSSGAYLANMLGATAGHAVFDAPLPDALHAEQPAHVNAVINYHGFTDFVAMQSEVTRRGKHRAARAPEGQLLGHPVADDLDRARDASPHYHIHAGLPPFLHLHGTRDDITPLDQTRRFHLALLEAGVASKFTMIRGARHRDPMMFNHVSIRERVGSFLHRHMNTCGLRELNDDARRRQAERVGLAEEPAQTLPDALVESVEQDFPDDSSVDVSRPAPDRSVSSDPDDPKPEAPDHLDPGAWHYPPTPMPPPSESDT